MTRSRPTAITPAPTSQPREWLDPDELATELKLPVSTLYSWRTRGIGPEAVRIGRHLRYSRQAVDVWLTEQIKRQSKS